MLGKQVSPCRCVQAEVSKNALRARRLETDAHTWVCYELAKPFERAAQRKDPNIPAL